MKAREIGDSYRLTKTSMGTTVHVIELRTGNYQDEFDHYVLMACHSKEEAKKISSCAMRLYEQKVDSLERPDWDGLYRGTEIAKYYQKLTDLKKEVLKTYVEMFPVLREIEDEIALENVDFSIYEVPLV